MRHTFLIIVLVALLSCPIIAQQGLLQQLKTEKNDSLRCELLFSLVVQYLNSDLDSLLLVADELERTADRSNLVKYKVSALNAKGLAHKGLGDFEKAVGFYLAALDENKKIGDKSKQAKIFLNLADLLRVQKQFDRSLSYQRQGLAISNELRDTNLIAKFSTNIGLVFNDKKEVDSAYHWYSKAAEIASRTEALAFEAITIKINLSGIEHKRKNYAEMVRIAKEALEASRNTGDNDQISLAATNVGLGLTEMGRPQEAIPYLLEAEVAATEYNNPHSRILVLGNLVDAYQATGQHELALEKTLRYIELKDSLQKSVFNESIAEMQTKYETREKDLQIERQKSRQRILLFSAIGTVLALLGLFQFFRNKQRLRQKEAELATQIEHAEAEKLREMDAMKTAFFANVSHEFRTPLTLIISPLRKLLDNPAEKPNPSLYRTMLLSGERLLDLVNQLLDLTKAEAGRLELQPADADVLPVLRGVAGSFTSLADVRQIRFETAMPEGEILARFDKDKLSKIVANLLSNAFKFTPEEGLVRLEVQPVGEDLSLTVRDTGTGIEATELPFVFERFYRAKEARRAEVAGSGIGLALTKELVELHGGSIGVESQLGSGTTFSVRLPILKKAVEALPLKEELLTGATFATAEPAQQAGMTLLPPAKTAQVLIVEDNPDVRLFVKDCLDKEYSILLAPDGKAGLEAARKSIPDLIISDVMMPHMDGFELCRELKTDDRTSHIPVVMLTARAEQTDKMAGLTTGADDYLIKPFDARELLARVANLISQRKKLQEHYRRSLTFATSTPVEADSVDAVFLKKVREAVEANLDDENFSVVELGLQVGMSRSQLHRKLSAITGFSPNEIIRNMRLERAKELLEKKVGNASEIAYMTGFNSPAYFAKCFKDYFGMTPTEV